MTGIAVAVAMNAALGVLLILGLRGRDVPTAEPTAGVGQILRRAAAPLLRRLTRYEPRHRAPDETDLMRDEAAI